jgi:transposase InsO family protein
MDLHQNARLTFRSREALANKIMIERLTLSGCSRVQCQPKNRRQVARCFTRPYTPRTNGKAARFIQSALREWAYVRHYLNSEECDQHLSPWIEHYNFHRPRGSLGYASPISRAPAGTTS